MKRVFNNIARAFALHRERLARLRCALGLHLPTYLCIDRISNSLDMDSFRNVLLQEDISAEYLPLIRNLDPASILTVSTIVSRLRHLFKARVQTDSSFFFLTPEEKKAKETQAVEFYPNIIQISPSVWAYGKYLFPSRDLEPSVLLDKHFLERTQTLGNVRGKNIIDAGGYIGDSALILADYTDKNVYSFEPFAENRERLETTLTLNHTRNIVVVPKALGDEKTTMRGKFQDSSSRSVVASEDGATEALDMTTLDDFVAEHKLTVGLIKVDVEGFEQRLLKGAERTIREQKPLLLISIYHNASDFFHIKPLLESWNVGYTFTIAKPFNSNIVVETLLIAEVK